MTCSCASDNPFLWNVNRRPSSFANDPMYKAKMSSGKSTGQLMTEVVRKKREENINHGTVYGLSKDRDAAMLRSKLFSIFNKTIARR
jgi:hypothetical protein